MLQDSECSEICYVRIPSVSFADSIPTPFGPTGHFPLIGGIGPLSPRGAFGAYEFALGFCFSLLPAATPQALRASFPFMGALGCAKF